MKYIYIETYGCSANQNNSEILKGLLMQSGYEITNNSNLADIIIINTCIVKGKTENKIKRRIQDLTKQYPDKLLIISGCMPETDFKEILKLNNKAILLGVNHFKDIIRLIRDYNENKLNKEKEKQYLSKDKEIKLNLPKIPNNKLISITQISEGCLGNCNFCKTKLAKGDLHSYDINNIIKNIESDLQQGAKEIWITSQDCAVYGIDKYEKQMLIELLDKILDLKHKFKLRLGMMNPDFLYAIADDLIKVYKNPKMYKFLHIPVQSGSDKVLKSMNRNYNIKQVEEIINKFKKEFPDIVIAVDIIVGYPNESERDFEKSLKFIEKYSPDVFNLSKFSKHKGTKAWKLKELNINVINKRASELMKTHREGSFENKKKFIGKIINVFVNKKLSGGLFEARDDNYDIVLISSKENLFGKNIKVKIINAGVHHLIGEG